MAPKRFLVRLTLFSVLLFCINSGLNHYYNWTSNLILVLVGLMLFVAITFLSYKSLYSALLERPALFVNRFMASIAIKLFFFIGIVVVSGLAIEKPESTYFILFFMAIYVLYMIFFTTHIMNLKKREKAA